MESLLLPQLLGLYFMIVGGIVMIRRSSLMPTMSELVSNRPVLLVLACLELIAGLAIVLTYPSITPDWRGVVAIVGWMVAAEGVIYLAMPIRKVQKMIRYFNTESWYVLGGVLSVVLGAYLAGIGFGVV